MKYVVTKTTRHGKFYFVNGPFPHWTSEGTGIPRRAVFDLRGDAKEIQRQVGGRIETVRDTTSNEAEARA
jgi:hypothetical protein